MSSETEETHQKTPKTTNVRFAHNNNKKDKRVSIPKNRQFIRNFMAHRFLFKISWLTYICFVIICMVIIYVNEWTIGALENHEISKLDGVFIVWSTSFLSSIGGFAFCLMIFQPSNKSDEEQALLLLSSNIIGATNTLI